MYHKNVHVWADQWFIKGEASFVPEIRWKRPKITATHSSIRRATPFSSFISRRPSRQSAGRIRIRGAVVSSEFARGVSGKRRHQSRAGENRFAAEEQGLDARRAPLLLRRDLRCLGGRPASKEVGCTLRALRYLLAHGLTAQAQPETIALARDVPLADFARQKQAAALFMRVGLWDRA